MTREELLSRLEEKGVHKNLYSLDRVANRSECYSIVRDNGTWKLTYSERGQLTDIATGLTQSEAYDLLYEEFRRVFAWE